MKRRNVALSDLSREIKRGVKRIKSEVEDYHKQQQQQNQNQSSSTTEVYNTTHKIEQFNCLDSNQNINDISPIFITEKFLKMCFRHQGKKNS